jgi:hypothetical protein
LPAVVVDEKGFMRVGMGAVQQMLVVSAGLIVLRGVSMIELLVRGSNRCSNVCVPVQDRIMPHETIQPQYLVTYSPAAQLKWLRQEVGVGRVGRQEHIGLDRHRPVVSRSLTQLFLLTSVC